MPSRDTAPSLLGRLLGEPLLWFLLAGALLFTLESTLRERPAAATAPPPSRQRLDPVRLRASAERALRERLGRKPSEGELDAEADRLLREEVLAREARRLGLDRADPRVRARLAELARMHLLAIDPPSEPDEPTLRAWHAAHADRYALPPRLRIEACRLPARESPEAARTLAEPWRMQLQSGERPPCALLLPPLPKEPVPSSEWARVLGSTVREALEQAEPGVWFGPVSTPRGLLLLRVLERLRAPALPFEAVRKRVRADWLEAERARRLERAVSRLLSHALASDGTADVARRGAP